jgi:hypothetical protein
MVFLVLQLAAVVISRRIVGPAQIAGLIPAPRGSVAQLPAQSPAQLPSFAQLPAQLVAQFNA